MPQTQDMTPHPIRVMSVYRHIVPMGSATDWPPDAVSSNARAPPATQPSFCGLKHKMNTSKLSPLYHLLMRQSTSPLSKVRHFSCFRKQSLRVHYLTIPANCWSSHKQYHLIHRCCCVPYHKTTCMNLCKFNSSASETPVNSSTDTHQSKIEDEDFKDLSEDERKHLHYIQLEYDLMYYSGTPVPDPEYMTNQVWLELMKCQGGKERKIKLKKILVNQKKSEAQLEKQTDTEEEKTPPTINLKKHSERFENTIFRRIENQAIRRLSHHRMVHAMRFGPQILIDLGFDEHMTEKAINKLISQIKLAYAVNKTFKEPFHFIFCNVDVNSQIMDMLNSQSADAKERGDSGAVSDYLMTFTEKDYNAMYPREELVYLTNDAPELMTHFDHNVTYIVGGLTETSEKRKLTFAKARRQGIKMQKFPLDKYLLWEKGSKNLNIDIVMAILLQLKESGIWTDAFQHIPSSCIRSNDQYQIRKKQKRNFSKKGHYHDIILNSLNKKISI